MPAVGQAIFQGQRDVVRIEYDAAPGGAQQPDYQCLVDLWPCFIDYLDGTEQMFGRQLEGDISVRIVGTWDKLEWGRYRSSMRLVTIPGESVQDGIFNVRAVVPVRRPHLLQNILFLCSEHDAPEGVCDGDA